MVLGFNHNIMYRGEVFHVQTEDSGLANPHIITLLYRGGVILCSKKTSYADILKMENLEDVVEELMKEQHKEIMRRLKTGEFDERIDADITPATQAVAAVSDRALAPPTAGDSPPSALGLQSSATAADISLLFALPSDQASPAPPRTEPPAQEQTQDGPSLDQAVLAFFGNHDKAR